MDITNPATDSQKNQQSDTVRISGIAVILWLVMILIGIGGMFLLDSYGVSTTWMVVWMTLFALIGFYFLFVQSADLPAGR
jgi:amino acid transporter